MGPSGPGASLGPAMPTMPGVMQNMPNIPQMPDMNKSEPTDINAKLRDSVISTDEKGDIPPPPGAPDAIPPAPPPPPGDVPPPPGMVPDAPGLPGMPGIPGVPGMPVLKRRTVQKTRYRLPVLNWKALKPSQIQGTIFNELDDEQILNEIDMTPFEEIFKTRAQDTEADKILRQKLADAKAKRGTSLIDTNRARNLAITLRKIGLTTDEICRAVYNYDLNELPLEYVEMLPKFIPNDTELKAFKQYEKANKPFDALSSEDKFMWLFGRVERLQQRLNIMIFIGNFIENIDTLCPQLNSVISASMSIRSSQKLKKILEIILAFGNYMNSARRGAVFGFKLNSLESLVDTKSTDKKQNLLHYICSVVQSYYPEYQDYYSELRYVDQASKVSLDQVLQEVTDIRKGLDLTTKEYENHQNPVLKEFLQKAGDKVQRLIEDADVAQEAYRNVVQYFGETQKTMPPEQFFPIFQRFIQAYKDAEEDIEKWQEQNEKRAERAKKEAEVKNEREKAKKQYRDSQIDERNAVNELRKLKGAARGRVKSGLGDRANVDIQDGAIDENLAYLKSQPYRRKDSKTRSFRRGPNNPTSKSSGARGQSSML